jgi:proteasome accessory factor C
MSSKTATRLTRILAMLPWVIAHPGVAVDEVCDRFGYTRKQLLEDLDLVFVCGLPGYGPGDLMVAYVEDDRVVVDTADYFAGAPRLSAAESVALLASGLAVLGSGAGSETLARAVAKLSHSLLPDEPELFTVDIAGAEPEFASALRTAAAEGRVVEIVYTTLSRNDTTTRSIEPWVVFTSLGNWYTSGYCRLAEAERVFRLDRIRALSATDERFVPPASPPTPEVRYVPGDDDVECVITLKRGGRWVAEYYPLQVIEDTGDDLTVRFSASDPAVAAGLLLRLGGDGILMEGDRVGATLAGLRSRVLARYGISTT